MNFFHIFEKLLAILCKVEITRNISWSISYSKHKPWGARLQQLYTLKKFYILSLTFKKNSHTPKRTGNWLQSWLILGIFICSKRAPTRVLPRMGPEDGHNSVIYSTNIYLALCELERCLTFKIQGQIYGSVSLSAFQATEGRRYW